LHPQSSKGEGDRGEVLREDTFSMHIMRLIQYKITFFYFNLRNQLVSWFLRLGCYFFSSWYYIANDSILTTGKVLKLNRIYTYKEGDKVDIVRLTNVLVERRYLYCSLFFFSKNKIITVRQTMLKGAPILWSLSDNREFDELMSIRLWHEVNKEDELLEFDF
jgi:hypothetical protein